jgi:dihydrofolate synthase / folylpolyglutamate synthase
MTASEEIAEKLFTRTTQGIKLGLDRVRRAAEMTGNPQHSYASVHVAGTNGKGSTCAYVESALRAHGVKTGLFTSPHLVRFEERFMVDGRPVPGETWVSVYDDIAGIVEKLGLTFFEAVTLIAFELFKREKVEWAVIETGLGGRLDATNIVEPRVAAITSLGLDHMQYLGGDLPSIAREKLGIVKRDVPLVIARPGRPDIREMAERRCAQMNAPCYAVSAADAAHPAAQEDETCFIMDGRRFTTPLLGGYQIQNAMVAIKTVQCAGFNDAAKTAEGISRTSLPGRFQIIPHEGRVVVFDVGHNPAAAEAFSTALKRRFDGLSVCMVAGIMKDKDVAGVLRQFCASAGRLILTRPAIERAADCETLLRNVPADYHGPRECVPDVNDAVAAALGGTEKVVCVAGSFHTVGEAMKTMGIQPYANA